jgi:carboxypeptidase family protein
MKKFCMTLGGLLLMGLAQQDLLACTCSTPALETRVLAKVIFVGQALETEANDSVFTRFEVLESFTTVPTEATTIETIGICGGVQFETGKQYLVYGARIGELLEVGRCSGTRATDEAKDEIAYVREWSRKNPYTRNRLSGTLTDSSGRPVANLHVDLVSAEVSDRRIKSDFTFTDETGHFAFEKVPPGEYILGVNIVLGPLPFTPFPTQYFPGVRNRVNAATIRIYGSEQLDGFDFTLTDRIPTREVRVEARWWDGTPVTNALVLCRIGADDRQTLAEPTADDGTAGFTVFASDKFEVRILHLLWKSTAHLQPPPATVPDASVIHGEGDVKNQDVRFVISKRNDQRKEMQPAR